MKRAILTAFLAGVTIFSVFKYALTLREKNELLNNLNQAKAELVVLDLEKQKLSETLAKEKELEKALALKNLLLKDNLKAGVNKLAQRTREVGQLSALLSDLKEENKLLKQEKEDLTVQLGEVANAKANLEARLSSTAELKKAMRELRRQMHKVGQDIRNKAKSEDNYGFVVKDGKTTYPQPKVKIEVSPAPENK